MCVPPAAERHRSDPAGSFAAGRRPDVLPAERKAVRQIWPSYEWSEGGYACMRPGQYQRYFRALVQPQGSLIFAGEHMVDENGFMNAAVESGERAATQVLARMGLAQIRAA